MKFTVSAMALALAGCATAAPPPQAAAVASARIVPVGQPQQLSGSEETAARARMADYDRAMFRIEAGLKAQAPDGGAMDIMMFDPRPTGWRCGRVRFANPGGAPTPFAAKLDSDPAEVVLGRDPAALARIRTLCG
jgi:hypothetical protein